MLQDYGTTRSKHKPVVGIISFGVRTSTVSLIHDFFGCLTNINCFCILSARLVEAKQLPGSAPAI